MKSLLLGLVAVVLVSPVGGAESARPSDSSAVAMFERLKSLIGERDAPLPKDEVMTDVFRLIGSGSAILHEEWKSGQQLTATVFYVADSQLKADHYCDLGNQLRYVARSDRYGTGTTDTPPSPAMKSVPPSGEIVARIALTSNTVGLVSGISAPSAGNMPAVVPAVRS